MSEGSPRLWEKSATHEDFLGLRLGTGNIPSPNQIVVPKEQIMAVHDPLNDKVDEIKATMAMLNNVPVDLSLYSNRMVGVVSIKTYLLSGIMVGTLLMVR